MRLYKFLLHPRINAKTHVASTQKFEKQNGSDLITFRMGVPGMTKLLQALWDSLTNRYNLLRATTKPGTGLIRRDNNNLNVYPSQQQRITKPKEKNPAKSQ